MEDCGKYRPIACCLKTSVSCPVEDTPDKCGILSRIESGHVNRLESFVDLLTGVGRLLNRRHVHLVEHG